MNVGKEFPPKVVTSNQEMANPCQGYTLVELMVVVAMIALLASLILPALAQAKKSARRIQCVSNLRQMGLAAQMYWDEHDGLTFRYKGAYTNGGDVYWFGWLERWRGGNEGRRGFDLRRGALYPYLLGQGVALCPSLNTSGEFKFKAAGATYGYGYNRHLSPPASQPPYNMNRLQQPAETVLMADAAQINDFQYPASPDNPLLEEFYYVSADESKPTAHFRHGEKANALFCDGHVGSEKAVPGSYDDKLLDQHVGKLRAEILRVP